MEQIKSWIRKEILHSSDIFTSIAEYCADDMTKASEIIISAIKKGNKILWCGNGGSAAQAQHLSTELVCGLRTHDRIALSSMSLTTDTSLLTAWANDSDFKLFF